MLKTALIFGSTGLIGSHLLKFLCEGSEYEKVIVFTRRSLEFSNIKIIHYQIDFNELENVKELITGEDLFICLGTTIKQAGSKKKFSFVDLELPIQIASIASSNNVKNIVVVSSVGANAKAQNFYLQTKGKMENKILLFDFENHYFFRPSILYGRRKEHRFGEEIGKISMKMIAPLLLRSKYKGIPADFVAKAMKNVLIFKPEQTTFYYEDIIKLNKLN